MAHPDLPRLLSVPPSPAQPDRLVIELQEARAALAVAGYHIKAWRADPTPEHPPLSLPYLAHEALHQAGQLIDRIAEMLTIQAWGTRATQQSHSAQPLTTAPPTGAGRWCTSGPAPHRMLLTLRTTGESG
jgi:hypothetical protein